MEQQKEQQLTVTLAHIATAERLHEKCQELLERFSIKYAPVSPANLPVDAFLEEKFVTSVHNQPLIRKIREICVVGIATQDSFLTGNTDEMTEQEFELNINNDKYQEMAFFSIDAREHMTRTEIATLTRAFNRRMVCRPVVLFVRSGQLLSLSTCERTAYVQSGHQGEKAGRVTILRDIDCSHPHRGHLDILCALDLSGCKSYDELYARWLDAFSNELLTRKFYSELSDWYAWAVQVAKFPNRLDTTDDDARFNHESCIRLITRLIFVWFLKQKKLIPDEFFDEQYIRENLIADFNPHASKTLLYDAEQSKYYRLVLQNLFFAMLNRPIVAEDKTSPDNRRFRRKVTGYHLNSDYNVNNLMRYEGDFMEGGARKFMKLANTSVPFLNGGLFDCLDDKDHKLFYDGFSEQKESLEQLSLPDYLFFGDEVGRSVDLSQWYDDKAKKSVSARGLIDILKRYSFTIEENTPLDQEVSLDPELLGKVFENLLASFNPETKTSARKQTGSFYTPREIVQYMVDESLVAHLKRMCGDELETQYRLLLSYSSDEVDLSGDQREDIMRAIYNCRVLDPACGSGAFPMGMLQQMVHVLKRVDPDNEKWKQMVVDLTIKAARKELEKAAKGDEHERQKIEANREARLADIESAFNSDINDPDYARKLYLIEHCIYGVDIQPIATQISKLRFFISLVVDQKPTDNAKENFGIRPLPNLEAKFVTANTLIPLDRNRSLFTATDDIRYYEEQLHDLNHRIFLAKRNKDKKELREQMNNTRRNMAQTLENLGAIGPNGFAQLTEWNMFDQNASASFFDPEWMFGVKEGFDVVIGNPPYGAKVSEKEKKIYKTNYITTKTIKGVQKGSLDTYTLFLEKSYNMMQTNGYMTMIVPISVTSSDSLTGIHRLLFDSCDDIHVSSFAVRPKPVFKNATVNTSIIGFRKTLMPFNHIYATKMYRHGRNFNLQYLVDNLQFADVKDHLLYGRIPKISDDLESSILTKFKKCHRVGEYLQENGSPIFYRTTGGRYFKVVTNYSTGSNKEKPLLFNRREANSIGCILSSNLSFWFYQIYSNNLDWKSYEISEFRLPPLSDETIVKLEALYEEYLEDIERNANRRQSTEGSRYKVDTFKEYKIGRSKAIIDRIDDLICPLYGLTQEETEFVKNYEIEFRLSDEK